MEPPAGADGGDLDHRGADDEAELDRGLGGQGDGAADNEGDVERGAAEVAGNDVREARGFGNGGGGDDAGGGAGEGGADGKAAGGRRGHDAAVGLDDVERAGEAAFGERAVEFAEVAADDRLKIGVQRGGRGALELADLRQDLGGAGDVAVGPDGLRSGEGGELVGRVGIGVDEDDGEGFGAIGEQVLGETLDFGRVDFVADAAVGEGAFGGFEAHVAVDDGNEIAPQAPGLAAVAAAHFQNVAEPGRRDQPHAGALAFEQGVGADSGAVDDGAEVLERAEGAEAGHEAGRFVAAVGRDFGGFEAAGLVVEQEHVGEGAADVDAYDARHEV